MVLFNLFEECSNYLSSNDTFEECLKEAIKCHINDIAEYFEYNLISQNKSNKSNSKNQHSLIERIISYGFKYKCSSFKECMFDEPFSIKM